MRRNCNLELCLFPQYVSDSYHNHNNHMVEEKKDSDRMSSMQNQQRPLTIFYDGKMCVTDVTEFQAKSILMMANKKEHETVKISTGSEPSTSAIVQSPHQLYSPGPGPALSMKTSLQRFLQKRKNRIQQASPYNH
ncbi:unnamed protein product [Vicia faba]|uniref:Protein TIFY n=1 Tax=Vicia faba TaxID=3906 RepID=A0AAV0YXJ1_VICFA|nr:unnamed protein product [Vicia faba]